VVGLLSRGFVEQVDYRGARPARLCRWLLCAGALVTASLSAGCSTSYQLGAMPGNDEDRPVIRTGSIRAVARPDEDGPHMPPASDLAYAKVAAAEVLSRGGRDSSQPWENPQSGARGTVTPLADAYRMEGSLCRDFLASYVADGSESWLQGEACRGGKGRWEVRRLKPWRRT